MSWMMAAKTRLGLLFARGKARSRADREIDFHIDMETERLEREERLPPGEARRLALAAFGGVTQHKETLRRGSGLAWLGGFSLDLLLGLRILRKYPGLTVVGGVAMAFAIWVATIVFHGLGLLVYPTLPLPGGDRVVKLASWNSEANGVEPRALHEFLLWRNGLTTVSDLGAYRDAAVNLVIGAADARVAAGAEVTAAAFRIAPTPPLLGRTIIRSDEEAGAPAVVVLGYDLWRRRFASDSAVIGQSVRLGSVAATVVGVMPKGFAFPVSHELWTQFRPDIHDRSPRTGPAINIFGRLAPHATLEAAQAELAGLGRRTAAEYPEAYRHIAPRVALYTRGFAEPSLEDWVIAGSIATFVVMLLVLVCGNVALLIFARAAAREGELVVRSALGASRGRIVMQLFAEALVLGGAAGLAGLAAADYALSTWGMQFIRNTLGQLPFWYDRGLSAGTVATALLLTVLAAVIAGVLPALRITRGLGARLKQGTAGGGAVRFGGVWTVVIVCQVAITVAFPSIVALEQRELRRVESFDIGFAAGEYLGVLVGFDEPEGSVQGDSAAAVQRAGHAAALDELRRRVAAEPGVSGVSFVDRLPRLLHEGADVEVDVSGESGPLPLGWARIATIDPSYFHVLEAPLLAGRQFTGADVGTRVAIVDQGFVDQVLQGRNAIGVRMRFVPPPLADGTPAPAEPWHEIVGVSRELGMTYFHHKERASGVYLPADPARAGPMYLVVHASGDPLALVPRVRAVAAGVDSRLRLEEFQRADQVTESSLWVLRAWLRLSLLLTAIAVLLSLAGIYAVLSFTVSRRTSEIGVRVALGASRRQLVAGVFRRPLSHVAAGVVAGGVLIVLAAVAVSGGDGGFGRVEGGFSPANLARLLAYVALMFGVCLLACIVPMRRALTVEPTRALRAD